MPFLHIRLTGKTLPAETIGALQREVTGLMAAIMGKKPELTAVLIEDHERGRWSVSGKPVSVAAHLDVKVTAGTNSAEEKAQFVRHAHALLAAILGPALPLATYVVIDEIPADAWGYGGLTQEARRSGTVD